MSGKAKRLHEEVSETHAEGHCIDYPKFFRDLPQVFI